MPTFDQASFLGCFIYHTKTTTSVNMKIFRCRFFLNLKFPLRKFLRRLTDEGRGRTATTTMPPKTWVPKKLFISSVPALLDQAPFLWQHHLAKRFSAIDASPEQTQKRTRPQSVTKNCICNACIQRRRRYGAHGMHFNMCARCNVLAWLTCTNAVCAASNTKN